MGREGRQGVIRRNDDGTRNGFFRRMNNNLNERMESGKGLLARSQGGFSRAASLGAEDNWGFSQKKVDKWKDAYALEYYNTLDESDQAGFRDEEGNFSSTKVLENDDFNAKFAAQMADRQAVRQKAAEVRDNLKSESQALTALNAGETSDLGAAVGAGVGAVKDMAGQLSPIAGAAIQADTEAQQALKAAGIDSDNITKSEQVLAESGLLGSVGQLINGVYTRKTEDFAIDRDLQEYAGSSYGGSYSDWEKMESMAGKKVGTFGLRKMKSINEDIRKAQAQQNKLAEIAQEAKDQKEMADIMASNAAEAYQWDLKGGFDARYAQSAAEGSKIELELISPSDICDFAPEIILIEPEIMLWEKTSEPRYVQTAKAGARLLKELNPPEYESTEQKNIIPEGSMHRAYHHMPNMKGYTKKGIPVLSTIDNMQAAEIEREEIIFSKEVTQKLEELYNIYFDDESFDEEKTKAALDAGRLLTTEIMCNTDDRTGLIDTLQKGGNVGEEEEDDEANMISNAMRRVEQSMIDKDNAPHEQTDTEKKYGINEPKNPFKDWVNTLRAFVAAHLLSFVYGDGDYDYLTAYKVYPREMIVKFWDAKVNPEKYKDVAPEEWHLGSVYIDEKTGDWIFLKKGFNVLQNPELGFQFQEMLMMPYDEIKSLLTAKMMRFDKDNNRWVLIDRAEGTSWEDDLEMIKCLMCGATEMPEQKEGWKSEFKEKLVKDGGLIKQVVYPEWFL